MVGVTDDMIWLVNLKTVDYNLTLLRLLMNVVQR